MMNSDKVKWILVVYDTNLLLLCYIILFISEPSITFSVLHDHVTCDYDIYNHLMTCVNIMYNIILYFLSKFKIKKSKVKLKKKLPEL